MRVRPAGLGVGHGADHTYPAGLLLPRGKVFQRHRLLAGAQIPGESFLGDAGHQVAGLVKDPAMSERPTGVGGGRNLVVQ